MNGQPQTPEQEFVDIGGGLAFGPIRTVWICPPETPEGLYRMDRVADAVQAKRQEMEALLSPSGLEALESAERRFDLMILTGGVWPG